MKAYQHIIRRIRDAAKILVLGTGEAKTDV